MTNAPSTRQENMLVHLNIEKLPDTVKHSVEGLVIKTVIDNAKPLTVGLSKIDVIRTNWNLRNERGLRGGVRTEQIPVEQWLTDVNADLTLSLIVMTTAESDALRNLGNFSRRLKGQDAPGSPGIQDYVGNNDVGGTRLLPIIHYEKLHLALDKNIEDHITARNQYVRAYRCLLESTCVEYDIEAFPIPDDLAGSIGMSYQFSPLVGGGA